MKKKYLAIVALFLLAFSMPSWLFSDYHKPSDVSSYEWEQVKPYLIPEKHPVKIKLDKLFAKLRFVENSSTILKAGFKNAKIAAFSQAIISENPHIKGYFFKFYSDEQEIEIESKQWVDRAFEARHLQETIKKMGYEKYFVVPRKWIYLIPKTSISKGPYPKHYILVAKRISILKSNENRARWHTCYDAKFLSALFKVIEKEGLPDSTVPHNIPFTKGRKIAFIDLEQHHRWPVPSDRLLRFLNPEMGAYWQKLITRHQNQSQ